MSLRINLNTAGLTAHRNLSGADNALGKSIERLSSGFRINGAGDDPAGLVISEKLRAQVGGIGMAIKNAGDAVNMVKTAEGALQEVHRLLRSMRDLAVHSANTGGNDQAATAADQQQIANAIASINKIADETQFGNKKLLNGAAGVNAMISGNDVIGGSFTSLSDVTLADGDTISVNVTTAAEKATLASADLTAGITANGTLTLNGVGIDYTTADTAATLAEKINAVAGQTGVTATVAANIITMETVAYGSDAVITATESSAVVLSNTSLQDAGVDAVATVTLGTTAQTWSSGEGLVVKDSSGNSISLNEAGGSAIANLGEQFMVDVGTLTFQVGAFAGQTRDVSISSVTSAQLGTTAVSGTTAATIDVTTYQGAEDAIKVLDEAISQVSSMRATLGATQKNVLESSITSLSIAKENIAASESAIRDTDMASEMVEFTKLQIMQQAGVAMLAQANSAPQALLSLLR